MAELATEQTLAGLSWYAQAAYATRCARRVQPLYVTTNQDAREGLEQVIVALEAFVQGAGRGYVASRLFSQTSFPDLSFEMAAAVYTSFGAGQACSIDDSDKPIDDSTIPSKTYRAATTGLRAFERTTFAPGPEQRTAAVETYVAATLSDVETLTAVTDSAAGVLGSPINLASLGPLWPDGAPNWLPGVGSIIVTQSVEGLVRFDDPNTGPVLINPRLVAIVRPISSGVTEVLLNLGTRIETVVSHLHVEQVQAGLRGRH